MHEILERAGRDPVDVSRKVADFDTQALTGGSVVTNSTCAVRRAVKQNSSLTRVRPLAARSWVDLSAISES